MKRLLVLIAMLATMVACIVPSTASAWPTNLERYGIGLHSADLTAAAPGGTDYNEFLGAALANWSVRASLDMCKGSGNPASFYGATLVQFAQAGVGLIPVIKWTDCNGHDVDIDTQGERDLFQGLVANITASITFAYEGNGVAAPNVIEFMNEPNCMSEWGTVANRVSDYWTNVLLPGKAGARSVDSDINIIPGGVATTSSGSCVNAPSWISQIVSSGKSSDVNAYGVHAYGRTGSTDANSILTELDAACDEANRFILADEVGIQSEGGGRNEASQDAEWNMMHAFLPGVVPGVKAVLNWPGRDTTGVGTGSTGIYRTTGAGKTVLSRYIGYGADGNVGSLSNTHC